MPASSGTRIHQKICSCRMDTNTRLASCFQCSTWKFQRKTRCSRVGMRRTVTQSSQALAQLYKWGDLQPEPRLNWAMQRRWWLQLIARIWRLWNIRVRLKAIGSPVFSLSTSRASAPFRKLSTITTSISQMNLPLIKNHCKIRNSRIWICHLHRQVEVCHSGLSGSWVEGWA